MYRFLAAGLAALFLCLIVATGAQAYRPSLEVAYPASDKRAQYECLYVVFPLDPWLQRCNNSGTRRDTDLRYRCDSDKGRQYGAWCMQFAWATNNARTTVRLWIKVTEDCGDCYGYHTRTYYRRWLS